MTFVVDGSTIRTHSGACLKLSCNHRRRCSVYLRLTTALSKLRSSGGLTSHLFLAALSCGHAHEAFDIETEKPWSGCVLIPRYVRATKQNGLSRITTLRHSIFSVSPSQAHSSLCDPLSLLPCVAHSAFPLLHNCDHHDFFVNLDSSLAFHFPQ
jgi:hypothetical protein